MNKYSRLCLITLLCFIALYSFGRGADAAGTNLAPNGTGYRWHGLTTRTSNANRSASVGINDNILTTDVPLTGSTSTDDPIGTYEAAGVIWSSAQTVSSVNYLNGTFDSNSNGVFTGSFGLQFTTDGTTWTDSGWGYSPAYTYDSSSAAKKTYTFTGNPTSVRGVRAIGQVHASDNSNSWHANTYEVQVYGSSGPTPTFVPPTVTPSPTSNPSGWPTHYYAPYIDVSLRSDLTSIANTSGSKFFTLAFIIDGNSNNCTATWGGTSNTMSSSFLVSELANLRAAGGDVIISFGGAAGNELALDCSSVSALQAQYQSVINKYHVTHLDFDVEGTALDNTSANDRRNKAIKGLLAANPNLVISYTLPVDVTGLASDGIALLNNAVSDGTRVDLVNIMTMDYANDSRDMGSAATQAATSTVNQLKSVFTSKSTSALWYMMGITSMIGKNDTLPETFTLSNATTELTFSQQNGVRLIAMWSMNRDHQCPNGTTQPADTCSGVTQSDYQFSKIWKAFNQ
jgi:hypothetical protein